ncbi:MAG: TPM domain-containing protein [bacterium]|nr:TPM domain-containing protein [bacterium]
MKAPRENSFFSPFSRQVQDKLIQLSNEQKNGVSAQPHDGKIMGVFLVLCFLFAHQAYAKEVIFPETVGYVNDFANIISEDCQLKLNQTITELHQKAQGAEVSVVTVQSIEPLSVEEYAIGLFEKWGIGKKGTDNGVLFLIAIKERKLRIEVGYGLEGALPDGKCGEIRDRVILPYFKQGNLERGIYLGSLAIIQAIAREYQVEMPEQDGETIVVEDSSSIKGDLLQFLFLLFLAPFVILKAIFFPSSRRRYYGYGGFGGSFGGFGGSFGGFGGGMSGGGGASGGW